MWQPSPKITTPPFLQFVILSFFCISGILSASSSESEEESVQCGYLNTCPATSPNLLNVHLVPHSHDDIGWLKTVDQYYYGDNSSIQQAAVQYTLDSVIDQLQKNTKRRFIYVETGFFWRWWEQQDEETKEIVKELVRSGRLEFISGGWVMNDEATTHYSAIIDQMTLGLRFINDTFGPCAMPKTAWQIDPFGHSREQASLFAQMGYEGLFFGRLDYQDKYYRRTGKQMEMIWKGSESLGKDAELFTGVLFNGYNPPDGFCFDIFCNDDPINDDPRLFGYNVKEKVQDFIKVAEEWIKPYETNNVLMTMGSDFQYLAAHTWYKNLDKLIKYVNAQQKNGSRINVFYSTPTCYLKEVNKAKVPFKTKTDDFFPYASDPHAFWSGYFTSRPNLKYFVQWSNSFLQACKQLTLSSILEKSVHNAAGLLQKVWTLSEAMAVLQHHDAVSGTAKQHVTDDYSLRLNIGVKACEEAMDMSLKSLLLEESNDVHPKFRKHSKSSKFFHFCPRLNISECASSESNEFTVTAYNPMSRQVNTYLRIPVVDEVEWTVTDLDTDGEVVENQITLIPNEVKNIPGRVGKAEYEIVFQVRLAPFGFGKFHLKRLPAIRQRRQLQPLLKGPDLKAQEDLWVGNGVVKILLSGQTGLIKQIQRGSTTLNLSQNFYYYVGAVGNNSQFEFRASGAYIFRPNGTEQLQPIQITDRVFSFFVFKGSQVTEIHQVFTDWISQIIRIYEDSDLVEFEWLVGPVPEGLEVVTRYSSDIPTNGIFWTDANGREILKRKRDFRETWLYNMHEPVAGNYYPVNSRMIINSDPQSYNKGIALSVFNDRAQGGTSMNDGEIELMIHRRLTVDDAFGVGEALDEKQFGKGMVVRGRHWLLLSGEGTNLQTSEQRKIAEQIWFGLGGLVAISQGRLNSEIPIKTTLFYELSKVLPPNIHVLTIEGISKTEFLLRLEHFYEASDGSKGNIVVINMEALQSSLPFIKSLRETTLGGNAWKSDINRLQWTAVNNEADESSGSGSSSSSSSSEEGGGCPNDGDCGSKGDILMRPMEIKTFLVQV